MENKIVICKDKLSSKIIQKILYQEGYRYPSGAISHSVGRKFTCYDNGVLQYSEETDETKYKQEWKIEHFDAFNFYKKLIE